MKYFGKDNLYFLNVQNIKLKKKLEIKKDLKYQWLLSVSGLTTP